MVLKNRVYIIGLLMLIVLANKAQPLNYYYGNLHSHSGYSDGNKDAATTGTSTPAGDFVFAKASLHFNFLGISDHNHSNAGMQLADYALGMSQANSANQENTFLCFYGMEWGVTTNSGDGHVIVYGYNQLIGWENGNYNVYCAKSDYATLFKLINSSPNAFCYLAHPGWNDFQYLTTNPYSLSYDSAIVGLPFRSGLAFSTLTNYSDYPSGDYFNYYRKLLSMGYHVGMTYDHDNHYLTFGRNNAGRLVVMAPSLTQSNFYTAMKAMHFYASDDWNTKLDFKIGTKIMGDSTSGITPPVINIIHNDDDGELADSVKLWSGVTGSNSYPTVLAVSKSNNTLSFTDNAMVPGTNKYYFVEVIQNDGDRIVSSPIWYRLSTFASVPEIKNDFSFIMFPNPVNSVLYIATGLNQNYQVNITDITGKKIFSEIYTNGEVKISTSELDKGIYFVEVKTDTFSKTQKLVIE